MGRWFGRVVDDIVEAVFADDDDKVGDACRKAEACDDGIAGEQVEVNDLKGGQVFVVGEEGGKGGGVVFGG